MKGLVSQGYLNLGFIFLLPVRYFYLHVIFFCIVCEIGNWILIPKTVSGYVLYNQLA